MTRQLEAALASLSIVFPAYNDSFVIADQVRTTAEYIRATGREFEIIVVNDGSQDDTGALLENAKNDCPELIVIHHLKNRGYGGALTSGFLRANKELVFYTDGDGQYDPKEVSRLLALLDTQTDVVNGYKASRSDAWYRIWIGSAYQSFVRFAFHLPIRDADCDFRLIRRSALSRIQLADSTGAFCVELIKKLDLTGARFQETAVSHFPRRHGKSEFFRWRNVSATLASLAVLWWKLRLSTPLIETVLSDV